MREEAVNRIAEGFRDVSTRLALDAQKMRGAMQEIEVRFLACPEPLSEADLGPLRDIGLLQMAISCVVDDIEKAAETARTQGQQLTRTLRGLNGFPNDTESTSEEKENNIPDLLLFQDPRYENLRFPDSFSLDDPRYKHLQFLQ